MRGTLPPPNLGGVKSCEAPVCVIRWFVLPLEAMLADPCSGDRGEYGGRAP